MDFNFFPEKGTRKNTIQEKYDYPVLRLPKTEGEGRTFASFEFNRALVNQLGLTPDNYLVFSIADNKLYALVTDSLPEGTKPCTLSVGKTDQKSSLGKVRRCSNKPVANWITNSLTWAEDEMDLFFHATENVVNGNVVFELNTQEPKQEEQTEESYELDKAEEFINTSQTII